ncbi:hypothetical protein DRO32_02675 [Candidatus Bathyarchaeota archaeon]|nr:MAG: hypothetical protein DRO32_02675 [Candidatus Bathyarchaeota archaeon]
MAYIEEERFLDTLVVDSEGYICGRVASFEITPEKVFMKLYKEVEKEELVTDVEKLKEDLMLTLFGKVSPKAEKKLYDRIRKELKLPSKSPISDDDLVRYARMLGLDIPTRTVKVKTRVDVEEPVDLEAVECMNEAPLGKCIILKKPIEATRRGVEILDFVPYKSTAEVRGMMVIDREAKIIGHAERILIGKPLGLRIIVENVKETETIDFEALMSELLAYFKKPKALYERVAKDLGTKPEYLTEDQIVEWAERAGFTIPKKKEVKLTKEMTLDVPWTVIRKIGDVILLNKTLEELKMRGVPMPSLPEAPSAEPKPLELGAPSEPKPLDLS